MSPWTEWRSSSRPPHPAASRSGLLPAERKSKAAQPGPVSLPGFTTSRRQVHLCHFPLSQEVNLPNEALFPQKSPPSLFPKPPSTSHCFQKGFQLHDNPVLLGQPSQLPPPSTSTRPGPAAPPRWQPVGCSVPGPSSRDLGVSGGTLCPASSPAGSLCRAQPRKGLSLTVHPEAERGLSHSHHTQHPKSPITLAIRSLPLSHAETSDFPAATTSKINSPPRKVPHRNVNHCLHESAPPGNPRAPRG